MIAIIAILAAIATFYLRPDPTRQLAREITQLHQQARYESINTNTLILSTWNPDAGTWQISRVNTSNPCSPSDPLHSSGSYGSISANTRQYAGIIWQPNGLPVTCSGPGQPVAQQQLTLNHGNRSTTITFNSTGRGNLN